MTSASQDSPDFTRLILLCEGNGAGFDCRLLKKLLPKTEVHAVGSRFGMRHRVEVLRQVTGRKVFAILDRDFAREWSTPLSRPIEWQGSQNAVQMQLGWFWERKELENYLIAPAVVEKIFAGRFDVDDYQSALAMARDRIAAYQAARMTLSMIGRSGQYYMPTSMGRSHGDGGYLFPASDSLEEIACRHWVAQICEQYVQNHTARADDFGALFAKYMTEFSPGGERFAHFLAAFSGKDLAFAMEPWLIDQGFGSVTDFLNKAIDAIETSAENVAAWLPEWKTLKMALENDMLDSFSS